MCLTEDAGILPGFFITGPHADGLIALLECIRGADHLLVERLIKSPFHPADIGETSSSCLFLSLINRDSADSGSSLHQL